MITSTFIKKTKVWYSNTVGCMLQGPGLDAGLVSVHAEILCIMVSLCIGLLHDIWLSSPPQPPTHQRIPDPL